MEKPQFFYSYISAKGRPASGWRIIRRHMPKTRKQKEAALQDAEKNLQGAKSVVFVGYHGLTVPEIEILRAQARADGIVLRVIKKTLLQRAFASQKLDINAKELGQGLAVAFSNSDEVAAAKLLAKFQKDHEVLKIYGGLLENKFVDASAIVSLSKLPGKLELYAKLVSSLNAPVSGFVNVLAGTMRGLVSVLNGIKDVKAI